MGRNRERATEYQRKYRKEHPPTEVQKQKARDRTRNYYWNKLNKAKAGWLERQRVYKKKWRINHPENGRKWARLKALNHPEIKNVNNHARYIPRSDECELCGGMERLEKHHPDYSESEVIVTLCKEYHTTIHLESNIDTSRSSDEL